jgi:uncharacterized protein (TIGR02300 family)
MAVHTQRGTKRTCQNEECGARFYDLMRNPITCPICHSAFVPPPVREIVLEAAPKKSRSPFHRPSAPVAPAVEAVEEAPELELVATDDADDAETKIESEGADVILELEDDDADSSGTDRPRTEGEKE